MSTLARPLGYTPDQQDRYVHGLCKAMAKAAADGTMSADAAMAFVAKALGIEPTDPEPTPVAEPIATPPVASVLAALVEIGESDDAPADFPVPADFDDLAFALADLEYSDEATRRVLYHAASAGSLECCEWVDDADRARLEAILPTSRAWESPRWDAETWELGTGHATADGLAWLESEMGPGCNAPAGSAEFDPTLAGAVAC